MSNELVKPEDFNIDKKSALELTKDLTQVIKERSVLEAQYAEAVKTEITPENIEVFRKLRLKIRDNRTKGIEPWHRTNKDYFLRGGQFIDAIKRMQVAINERMEDNLKEMEDHFVNLEKERISELHESRVAILNEYDYDTSSGQFGELSEDLFQAMVNLAKDQQEKRKEEERLLEEKRKEEERKAAEIAMRKDKLLPYGMFLDPGVAIESISEVEFNAYLERLEKAKADFLKEKEEAEKKAKEAEEKRKKAEKEAAALRAEAEAKAKEEARVAAELKAAEARKAEEERQKKLEEERKAQELLKAPRKEKLKAWLLSFSHQPYAGEDNDEIALEIMSKFNGFLNWAEKQIDAI